MKERKKEFAKFGWLLLGLVMVYFSGGDQPVWIAVWLAPLFILRFFREVNAIMACLTVLPGKVIVDLIADRGMTPFPSFKILLLYTTIGVAFGLLPYLFDRIFRHWLPIGLRTFLFPSLSVAIPFFIGSYGTWGAKANGLEDLVLLQLVSITGVAGISFLINWFASLSNEIWEQRKNRKLVRRLSLSFLMALVLVYGFGLIRLRSDYRPAAFMQVAGMLQDTSMRQELITGFIRLVRSSPEKPDDVKDIRESSNQVFHQLLSSSVAIAHSGFDMAVWPEGAVLIFDQDESRLIQLAKEQARNNKISLGISVAVYQSQGRGLKPGIQPLFKNKLYLISAQGDIEWEYAKGILVPGMEAAITIPGDRVMRITNSTPKITGAICYELDFPPHIRQAAKLKADLILGPSNDWEAIKNTHSSMARLRAIETGISLLRPANGGISIAVDPYGRILSTVDNTRTPGVPLTAVLPVGPIRTVYAALGDYFSWICLIISLACLTCGIVLRFRRKQPVV